MIHGPREDLTAGLRVESNHQLGTKNLTLAASATMLPSHTSCHIRQRALSLEFCAHCADSKQRSSITRYAEDKSIGKMNLYHASQDSFIPSFSR